MTSLLHRRRAFAPGYTLIELLIVIGLLGLAGALLVPQLVNRDSLRVQAAVRKIIGDIHFAQADALARQEYRRIHFYADGRGYCIVREGPTTYASAFDEDTADYIVDPISSAAGAGGLYVTDFTLDNRFGGVVITEVDLDGGAEDLVFDPLAGTIRTGDLPGSGGFIELTAGTDVFRILVAPFTGKLTVDRVDP